MVYETDFYTTRRPYRTTPSLSTYTISSEPSRQVRLLPGLGKVHVVHTYDRIVPYVGHKRLTVVPSSPVVVRLRPSTLYREFDRIENKLRPITYNSYTNDYLNSNSHVRIVYVRNPISSSYPTIYRPSTLYTTRYYPSYASYNYYPSYLSYYYPAYYPSAPTSRFYSTYSFYPSYRWTDLALYPSWRYNHFLRMFDDETRLIRAQTASLLQRVHNPVPRRPRAFPLPYVSRYEEVPARLSNDNYIHRMLISSPSSKSEYTTYHSDPVRKYFGLGRLACVTLVGDKQQPRRRNVYMYEDPVRNDIQLLSYYINKFRDEKAALAKPIKVVLSATRPSRIFSVPKPLEDTAIEEMRKVKEERAARFSKITEFEPDTKPKQDEQARAKRAAEAEAKAKAQLEAEVQAKKEAEAAERKAKEEKAAAEILAKKIQEEADLKAKKEREAKESAERAAELEKQAEQARLDELAKQAELEKIKQEEEEKARLEEEKRRADELKAEEEKQQLLRLEEIARQAEEEKEAELARQADELAELARQEAELAEQAKKEMEEAEEIRKAQEQIELEKKQAELEELSKIAQQDAELAEEAKIAAEEAQKVAEEAEQQITEVVDAEQIVEEDVPVSEEETPIVEEETPIVEEETPIVEEETPVVEEEETTAVEEETPVVEESEPIEESAPEENEVDENEE